MKSSMYPVSKVEAVAVQEETEGEDEAAADTADEAVAEAMDEAMGEEEVEIASASTVAVEMSKTAITPRQNMPSSPPSTNHSSGRSAWPAKISRTRDPQLSYSRR